MINVTIPTRGTVNCPFPVDQLDAVNAADVESWVNGPLGDLEPSELAVVAEAIKGTEIRAHQLGMLGKPSARRPSTVVRQIRRLATERRKLNQAKKDLAQAQAAQAAAPVVPPPPTEEAVLPAAPVLPPVPVNIILPGAQPVPVSAQTPIPALGPSLAPVYPSDPSVSAVPILPPSSAAMPPVAPSVQPIFPTAAVPVTAPGIAPGLSPAPGYSSFPSAAFNPFYDEYMEEDASEDLDQAEYLGLLSEAGPTPVSVAVTPPVQLPAAVKIGGLGLLAYALYRGVKEYKARAA